MTRGLAARFRAGLPAALPSRIGIAVSGGGDSAALLRLMASIREAESLAAVTVDHCLRPGSGDEARAVAETCGSLGISHETLRWDGSPGVGNLQARAREARFRLILDWARRMGLPAVAFGHTRDDQAETVLMRLARASGVTGLSAMRPATRAGAALVLRPLLGIGREELRAYLRESGADWAEDPTNEDMRFERVRARGALARLSRDGFDLGSALAQVADNMAMAEDALAAATRDAARQVGRLVLGDVALDRSGLASLPEEISRRILLAAIRHVGGQAYPPRRAALLRALEGAIAGRASTLCGCLVVPDGDAAWVVREFAAVRNLRSAGPDWDRWRLSGALDEGDTVAALGPEGLALARRNREGASADPGADPLPKVPRPALLASPGIWRGGDLVSAPLAGWPQGIAATPLRGTDWTLADRAW